uniref:NADH dehydrogenase subunit 11 n=1 Tax=Cyanophora paradoxa TaxID=2762 RepID=A0A097PBQ7_CYAPA|nr:NADH dehydrogenase subunit 11 [Cyanophora paradoxa]
MGALTSKPYAFMARPWELTSTETIDILDSACSAIRVDSKGNIIMRILPNISSFPNDNFISDKTRFSHDGIKLQRISVPLVKKNNEYLPITWESAFELIKKKINKQNKLKISAIAGRLVDIESSISLKKLLNSFGSNNYFNSENINLNYDFKNNYIFNSNLLNNDPDFCLLIGLNLRFEVPTLNIKFRRLFYQKNLQIVLIGSKINLSYPVNQQGISISILIQILEGKHKLSNKIAKSKNPLILVGSSYYQRTDFTSLNNLLHWFNYKIRTYRSIFNINTVLNAASHPGLFNIGFYQNNINAIGKSQFIYLLGTDELVMLNYIKKQKHETFIIYQGHHGDIGAGISNLILPTYTYLEKSATFMNFEGKICHTKKVITPVSTSSHEDWKVIVALSQYLNLSNIFNFDLTKLKNEINLFKNYNFYNTENMKKYNKKALVSLSPIIAYKKVLHYPLYNFYTTDSITRASKIMIKCMKIIKQHLNFI